MKYETQLSFEAISVGFYFTKRAFVVYKLGVDPMVSLLNLLLISFTIYNSVFSIQWDTSSPNMTDSIQVIMVMYMTIYIIRAHANELCIIC